MTACMSRILLMTVLLAGLAAGAALSAEVPVERESGGSTPATVRVAGIVLKWIRADKQANFRRAEPMIRQAAAAGAQIVVTTECFLDGYAIADKSIPLPTFRGLGEPIPEGGYYRRLASLAAELKIHLVAGMLEADGTHRYNTAVLIGPDGKLVGKYRKQKLGHETVRNTPGTDSSVFATPYGPVGMMICADRTEAAIVARFRRGGAAWMICPSGGMFGPDRNDPIVQSRSRENKFHIVFVHPAEFLVTGPDGSILKRTILGDRLLIPPEQAGGEHDLNRVFYFDVPLGDQPDVPADDKQWSQFRGPDGTGISHAAAIPTEWTDRDYNWKVELPGVGHASPVVRDNRIFVTCGDPESAGRTIVCLDTSDGHTLWQRNYPSKTFRQHRDNSYATATPAADDLGVVLTWSTPEQVVLLALDRDGGQMWRRDLGPFVGMHGSGSSPIIIDDLVVLANDQGDPKLLARILGRKEPDTPAGKSFLIAVDRRTGKTRWKLPRRTTLAAYSTPCVHRSGDGRVELIFTSTSHGVTAVDPATGKINWQLADVFRDRCVGSPVAMPGLVIGGFGHGISGVRWVALRPGPRAAGLAPALVYDLKKSVPLVPTPLIHRGRLYLWSDAGVVSCLNVADGRAIWQERVGGSFYGSPVCVGDRLYCIAKDGTVVVLAASDKYQVLARVPLGEPSFATPAVSGGVMYLRTRSHLFSLGGKTP